jgi:hypothetical protein
MLSVAVRVGGSGELMVEEFEATVQPRALHAGDWAMVDGLRLLSVFPSFGWRDRLWPPVYSPRRVRGARKELDHLGRRDHVRSHAVRET